MTDDSSLAERRQLLQATTESGFHTLRFPPALERDFLDTYHFRSIATVRRILPWLSAIYLLTCSLMLIGTKFEDIIPWVWNVLLPIGAALGYLWITLFVPKLAPGVHWHTAIAVSVSLFCTVRAVFIFQDTSLIAYIPYHVVYVMVILFSVVRLRLVVAIGCAVAVAIAALGMALMQNLHIDMLAFSQYYVITGFLSGIVGYAIEHRERGDYLKSELLRIEKLQFSALRNLADAEAERQRVQGEYLTTISGNLDADELARRTLTSLCRLVAAPVGIIYLVRDGHAQLAARQGVDPDLWRVPEKLRTNETLVGQVMANRRTLRLQKLPPGFMRIETGLFEMQPGELLVIPAIHDGEIMAVVELAMQERLHADGMALIERIMPIFASALVAATAREAQHPQALPA